MVFPYPPQVIPKNITSIYTIYGTKNCENCNKIKEFFKKKFKKSNKIVIRYYDIDELIQKKIIENYKDFQEKMEPFIYNHKTVPIIFVNDIFVGGYDNFMELYKKINPTNINRLKTNEEKKLDLLIEKILKKLI
jgi:glutaredoxin